MRTAELITFDQFEQMPDTPGKQELLDGELIEVPPARHSHSEICKRVYKLLETSLNESRVWQETGYKFPDGSWLQPDVSVSWPDQIVENDYFTGSPMLAVEVASRGNTAEQMDRKISHYFSHGAAEVWVIQPRTTSMTVYGHANDEISSRRITGIYKSPLINATVSVPDLIQGL